MTKAKFEEIKKDYERETERWNKVKVGDKVYQSNAYGDYFEFIIDEVNVDERWIKGRDQSQKTDFRYYGEGNDMKKDWSNGKPDTISHFETIEELKKQGIKLIDND